MSPATAPMMRDAAMPPAQASAGMTVAQCLGVGVDGGGCGAEGDADGTAEESEQDGFGEELGADVAPGGAEGAAQADLGAAFEDGDDHDVGDADRADQEGDGAEAEEQAVEGAFGVGLGDQGGGGLADVDLVGVLGVGGGGEEVVDGVDPVVLGAEVDGGGVAVEAQVLLCRGVADQDGGVDGRGEHGRFEDAGHVEPLAADPDAFAGVDAVDPEALGGSRAEHGDGFLGGGRVEVVALGDAGGDHREEVERCGLDGQGVGVDRGDVGVAVGVGAADRPGGLHLLHAGDPADHGWGGGGQLGGGRR